MRQEELVKLVERVAGKNLQEKCMVLEEQTAIVNWLKTGSGIRLDTIEEKVIAYSLLLLEQHQPDPKNWASVFQDLWPVEEFYKVHGGILGYHLLSWQLLTQETKKTPAATFQEPVMTPITPQTVIWGLKALPQMAEMYPVGGAGDRLNLFDEKTNEPLPAALLPFEGRTLLEGLIRDVEGRELLYEKVYGKRLWTPLALMTSNDKQNDERLRELCEEKKWFGRPKELFRFFCQPLVPVISEQGHWCWEESGKPRLKPGGHGMLWKLAKQQGIFSWFQELGRNKLLVRQINNPVAGTDGGLLGFFGVGIHENKVFGFASCPRQINTAEGMIVRKEEKKNGTLFYSHVNIEYTEFKRSGIVDEPREVGSVYSHFPTNTNVLFADLEALLEVIEDAPVPGLLMNLKTTEKKSKVGRLESTMQGIADHFQERFKRPFQKGDELCTYVTFNPRQKTISATKRAYQKGQPIIETPLGAFYDRCLNAYDLLKNYCHFEIPEIEPFEEEGPPFHFRYHPALGPLYSIIAQKLRGGRLERGAELELDLGECAIESLVVDGSLRILGDKDSKCWLKNVTVKNAGIDREAKNRYWCGDIQRKGYLKVRIYGDGEFVAENVTLTRSKEIVVPRGVRLTLQQDGSLLMESMEGGPSWEWKYDVEGDQISLSTLKKGTHCNSDQQLSNRNERDETRPLRQRHP